MRGYFILSSVHVKTLWVLGFGSISQADHRGSGRSLPKNAMVIWREKSFHWRLQQLPRESKLSCQS